MKNNNFFKYSNRNKINVSKLELKNSLLETIEHNNNALDYIQNEIYKTENILGVDPKDVQVQETLNIQKYIKFTLEYLDKQYSDNLRKLGVKI